MVTKLVDSMTRPARAVVRETAAKYAGRALLIKLEVGGRLVSIKMKGTRRWHSVTIDQIYYLGCRNTASEIKMAKEKKRKERKAVRS